MPALGNALGASPDPDQALKGRHKQYASHSGLIRFFLPTQGIALGWLVVGPLALVAMRVCNQQRYGSSPRYSTLSASSPRKTRKRFLSIAFM